MSKVAMNHDSRRAKRLEDKKHLKQKQWRGCPPLECARKVHPKQPTIIKQSTAKRLAYLENHGLADFSKCNLAVAVMGFIMHGTGHDLTGVPSYGI